MADESKSGAENAGMSGKLQSEIKNMFSKSGGDDATVNVDLSRPLSEKLLSMQDSLVLFGDTNYRYTASGHLRHSADDSGFKFENQKQYDQVGNGMEKFVQLAMKEDYGLKEVWLPVQDDGSEAPAPLRNNIFMSDDALTADTLAIVIQGSGAVRAGQWARSVCINDSLAPGTILPYLSRIEDRKWGVIVLNPNLTTIPDPSGALEEVKEDDPPETTESSKPKKKKKPSVKRIPIPGSESAQKHTRYVYDHFISKAHAKDLVIVAHSFGGVCVKELVDQRDAILEKLRAVAFTDSVHTKPPDKVADAFKRLARNWIASKEPLDSVDSFDEGCWRVSSGHEKHVYTSATAMIPVFKFLDDALSGGLGSNTPTTPLPRCPNEEGVSADSEGCDKIYDDHEHVSKFSHACPLGADDCTVKDEPAHVKMFLH